MPSICWGNGACTTAMPFLKMGMGVRASAMGKAFCAVVDDASTVHYNPAGLGQIKSGQISLEHTRWLEDVAYTGVSGVYPLRTMNVDIGGFANMLLTDEIQTTTEAQPQGTGKTFREMDGIFGVAGGISLTDQISVGVTGKVCSQKIGDNGATGLAYDMGFLYKTKCVGLGLAFQNIGTNIRFIDKGFTLPTTIRTGLAWTNSGLTISGELVNILSEKKMIACIGFEGYLLNIIALRCGYDSEDGHGPTVGFGVRTQGRVPLQIDYAYLPYEKFEATHRVAISVRFGNKAVPEPPNPVPEPPNPVPEPPNPVPEPPNPVPEPPNIPVIFSPSHPDPSKWYAANIPSFIWDNASGLTGYSYLIDQDLWTLPDDIIDGTNKDYIPNGSLADGIYYFHIKKRDSDGNWSDASHYKIQIDTQPPTIPVISSSSHSDPNKWYTANTPSLTWTASKDNASGLAGYSYLIDKNSGTIPDDIMEGANTAYIHNVPLANGIYYFHIKAGDHAGTWSNASHYKIQIDAKSPDIPVIFSISHPDQSKWYAVNTPSLSWTASCDDVSGLAGYSYLIDKNSGTIPDDTIEGANTAYVRNVPLVNGIYYFHIKARDYAGNWSNANHYKIQVDTKPSDAPVISSTSHPDQNKWYAVNTPSLLWTASCDDASGPAGYSYLIDENSWIIPDDTIDGTNTAYIHNVSLANGIYYFHIKAGDRAGNWSDVNHYRIQVDTKPPDVPVSFSISHPDQSKWYTANIPSLSWTASCDDASGLAGYSYLIDKKSNTIPNDTIKGADVSYVHNVPLTNGIYYFHVKARDHAGNWSNANHYKIQVDAKSPDIPVIFSSSHPDPSKWYAANVPSITWNTSCDDVSGLAGYSYWLDENSWTIPDDTIDGTNTAYIHNVSLANGTYYFHIKASDHAGNWSNANHYKIQVDTQPPATPVIYSISHPDPNKWYAANTPSLMWNTSSDDASGLAGYSYQLDENSGTIPDDLIEGTNTAYIHNVSLVDGIYYFHIKARDYAGNWSNASHYKIKIQQADKIPVLSVRQPSKQPSKQIRTVTVTVNDSPIRSGPGETYPVITKVSDGIQLILIDDSKKWYYQVKLPDNSIGWILYINCQW